MISRLLLHAFQAETRISCQVSWLAGGAIPEKPGMLIPVLAPFNTQLNIAAY
jgi:hypothetical protein